MLCNSCGNENPEHLNVCGYCGANLSQRGQQIVIPPQNVYPTPEYHQNEYTPYVKVTPPNQGKTILLIIFCLVFAIAGLALMFADPAKLYSGAAYNGIVANIRGAAFFLAASILFAAAMLLNRKK